MRIIAPIRLTAAGLAATLCAIALVSTQADASAARTTAYRSAHVPRRTAAAHSRRRSASATTWPGNPFSPSSVWNAALGDHSTLASDSRALTHELVQQVGEYGPWINTWDYSVPVYIVGPHQRSVHVTLDTGAPALQAAFDAVPIPVGARAALGTDEHMTVWQPSTNRLWDFWKMHRESDGWHARWGGEMNDVSHNPGYFVNSGADVNWGATATGLPLLGGLITFADLRRGYIDHALALAVPHTETRTWVWPAQRTDGDVPGTDATAIPEGTHFRLDPGLDLSTLHLSPIALMIARAAQRYGIVIRDKAGAVTFYGQTPTNGQSWGSAFGTELPNQQLAGFPWGRLQALRSSSACCWAPH